ncbi:hypothetical protein, partial [Escherichia coli]|uniref:hypothetical protein n=1 Tax=Escherichia coli TaxID=562 RepID=UPI001A7E1EC0
ALLILSFFGIAVSSDIPQFHQLDFRLSVNIVPAKNGLAGGCAVTGYISDGFPLRGASASQYCHSYDIFVCGLPCRFCGITGI